MKKWIALLLSVLLLLSLGTTTAFAAETDLAEIALAKPEAPNYFIFEPGEGDRSDILTMFYLIDDTAAKLASEYDTDSDAFYEKYGVYEFTIALQYDVSLDSDSDWQYTPEWDQEWSTGGYGHGYQAITLGSRQMDWFGFFDLYYCDTPENFTPYRPAIITKHFVDGDFASDTYHFDTENHSLYIRYRVYMEWRDYDKETDTLGERESSFSDWSDAAIFGLGSTQVIPEKPTGYDAPVISDLQYIAPDNEDGHGVLSFIQETPENVWLAGMYYEMTEDGDLDGLQTQVSIDGGDWVEFDTANSWGDWCLWNGERHAIHHEEYRIIDPESHIRIRVRFNGTDGPSEWSNILELNGGGTGMPVTEEPVTTPTEQPDEQPTEPTELPTEPVEEKCGLCGFCLVPMGLCLFIWLAIALAVILVIVILIATRKKRCPNCREKCKKKVSFCPKCGYRFEK